MGRKSLFLFPALATLCLTSCSGAHHEIKEYVLSMEYQSNFRILQLTDTHLGDKENTKVHYDFMDLTIKDANANFIVVTGDLFTFASKSTALEFFDYLDSHKTPWTVVFGNHDEQCYFSVDWLTGELNKRSESNDSYCMFKDIQDDDVHGNSNFAINLMKDGNIFEQLIFMDSNRYYFGSYFGYDYFKQNQIDWYSELIDATTSEAGHVVPSLMFYHIPLPEIREAWEENKDKPETVGVKEEESCNPDYNSGFFKVIKEKGSTKGMYFGHDHIDTFVVTYEGIDFGYGIKATDRVYNNEDLLGGKVITVKDDNTMEYQNIFHKYEEVL